MNWIDLTNFAAAVGGLIVALFGLALTLSIPYIERLHKRFFAVLFSILIAYVASDLISQISIALSDRGSWQMSQAALFCESLFSSLLMPLLTLYILRCDGEVLRKSPYVYAVLFLWIVYFALLVTAQFTTVIYYFTADNVYHRGSWYQILLTPPVLLMLINLFALYKKRAALTNKKKISILIYILIPLLCMFVQMLVYGLYMIIIGSSVSALYMFIFLLNEQTKRYIKQREKIAAQQASITALHMRPHFIYNTLTSIYYLCKQDPEKAQQVTLDFISYLRNNFTAVAKDGPIPFEEELEHTRAYLAVEQVRFENMLFVEFDTPHTKFRIPPLTLQPIVENAIKHGLSADLDSLYISVFTHKVENGSKIIVMDTGIGFTTHDKTKPHAALDNIRERLEIICGGSLTIKPRKAGGTLVTIFVPDKQK